MPAYTLLYDGALRAQRAGAFVKLGRQFEVVRPGYDIQGRRRHLWTQVVHDGIPVYTVKVMCPVGDVMKRFDALWDRWIADDENLLDQVLASNKATHMRRFRDGITGETVAPTHSRDGKMQAKAQHPS